jgi:hypothetical protein
MIPPPPTRRPCSYTANNISSEGVPGTTVLGADDIIDCPEIIALYTRFIELNPSKLNMGMATYKPE